MSDEDEVGGTGLPATSADAAHVTGRKKGKAEKSATFAQRLAAVKTRSKELYKGTRTKIPLRIMVTLEVYEFVVDICERARTNLTPNKLAEKCFQDGLTRYGHMRSMNLDRQMFEDSTFTVGDKYPQIQQPGTQYTNDVNEQRFRDTVNADLRERRKQQISEVPGLQSQANANRR